MPWDEADYEEAKRIAADSRDPEVKKALEDEISRFEWKASRPARAMNPQLNPFSGIAPTGMDALQSNPTFMAGMPEPETEEPRAAPAKPRPQAQSPQDADPLSQWAQQAAEQSGISGLENQIQKQVGMFEETLPSASKNPVLYRPPERIQEGTSFKQAMGAKFIFEPTVDEFKATMASKYGPAIEEMDENSKEYQMYADAKWAQAYDAAENAGLSVVRHAYMNTSDLPGKAAHAAAKVRDVAESAITGIGGGLSAGTIPEAAGVIAEKTGLQENALSEMHGQQARNPVASTAGAIIGSMNPASFASKATGVFRTAAGPAKTGLGNMAQAAGVGAAVGGLEGTIGTLAPGVSDLATGGKAEGVTPENLGTQVLISALLGGGGGAVGEAIGQGAAGQVRRLRDGPSGGALAGAEQAGVKTDFLGKVKLTPEIEGFQRSSLSETGGAPTSHAAAQVKGPIANAASEMDVKLQQRMATENARYYASPQGQQRNSTKPLLDTVNRILDKRTSETGEALPWVETAEFKKAAGRLWEHKSVPEYIAKQTAEADSGVVLTGQAARKLGLQAEQGYRYVVVPRRVNAQELDEVIRGLDDAAGVHQIRTAKPDPEYDELMRSARHTRDQFQPNEVTGTKEITLPNGEKVTGWSALKHEHSEAIRSKKETFQRAGLPGSMPEGGYDRLDTPQRQRFEAALEGFRSPTSGVDENRALLELAGLAGVQKELRDIAGTRYGLALKNSGNIENRTMNASPSGMLANLFTPGTIGLRLDPAMRAMAQPADTISPKLRQLLVSMRGGDDAVDDLQRRLGLPQAYKQRSGGVAAMRGGGVGARAVAGLHGSQYKSDELTDEDKRNLMKLIQAAEAEGAN